MSNYKKELDNAEYDVGDRLVNNELDYTLIIDDIIYSSNHDDVMYLVKNLIEQELEYLSTKNENHIGTWRVEKHTVRYNKDLIINKLLECIRKCRRESLYINQYDNELKEFEHEYKTDIVNVMDLIEDYEIKLTKDNTELKSINIKNRFQKDGIKYILEEN